MLQRLFNCAAFVGARLLFVASLVMLLWGIAYAINVLSNSGMAGPSLVQQAGWLGATFAILHGAFAPAAYLFTAALVVNHLDRWAVERQEGR